MDTQAPMEPAPLPSAVIAGMAAALRMVIVYAQDHLIYVKERPLWGLYPMGHEAIVHLAGAIALSRTLAPPAFPNHGSVSLGRLARCLARELEVLRPSGALLRTVTIDGRAFSGCVTISTTSLPWAPGAVSVSFNHPGENEEILLDGLPEAEPRGGLSWNTPLIGLPVLASAHELVARHWESASTQPDPLVALGRLADAEVTRAKMVGLEKPPWISDANRSALIRSAIDVHAASALPSKGA